VPAPLPHPNPLFHHSFDLQNRRENIFLIFLKIICRFRLLFDKNHIILSKMGKESTSDFSGKSLANGFIFLAGGSRTATTFDGEDRRDCSRTTRSLVKRKTLGRLIGAFKTFLTTRICELKTALYKTSKGK